MTKSTKYTFIILSVTICLFFNNISLAEDTDYKIVDSSEVPDILSAMASATQSNFEKIRTWEGRVTNETLFMIRGEQAGEYLTKFTDAEPNQCPNEIQQLSDSTVEFKIDLLNNRFFSLLDRPEPFIYLDLNSKKTYLSKSGSTEIIQIVTPEHQIDISPLSKPKNHVVLDRTAIIKQPRPTHRTDPREVFYSGNRTIWKTLSMFAQSLQTSGIETYGIILKEKSEGDHILYRLEISMPGQNEPFSILVFDSEAGFNPVYIENRYEQDGSLRSKITNEFAAIQDVFLPVKWEISQYFPDGGLMRREICTIEEQQINTAIPSRTFSELTYLKEGDQIRDEIQNKKYTIKAGKLVENTK